jgi:glucose-6-phosphate dehydrogenase assembly protein OpcA
LDQPHGTVHHGAVSAEPGNPSADLIAAWLASRLRIPVTSEASAGPGVTDVSFATSEGDVTLTRHDGRVAHLSRPGQPERRVALHRRDTPELLAEELRRLDPDEVYAESLAQLGPE